MQLLMLIDLNMNPSPPQDGFIVAQDRSFLKPRWSGTSGTSQIVSARARESVRRASGFVQVGFEEISPKPVSCWPTDWDLYSMARIGSRTTAFVGDLHGPGVSSMS